MQNQAPSEPVSELFARDLRHGGVEQVLRTIRKHLNMDVAFISRFRESDRVLETVDAGTPPGPLHVGQVIPLHEGYCQKIVRGELPELIPDTSLLPEARVIPATAAIPVGAHIGVPLETDTGEFYGTLCCFSYRPNPSLGDKELRMVRALAEVLAGEIAESNRILDIQNTREVEIRAAIQAGFPRIAFQPLYNLKTRMLRVVECLSRFDIAPYRPPDAWFKMAQDAGLGQELELVALRKALAGLHRFPQSVALAVNVSPELVLSGVLTQELAAVDLNRVLLEITEHSIITDYEALGAALAPLRQRGLGLAIDDAGAGYASMRHILSLNPGLIKLDMSLTRHIDTDPARRALAKALIAFSQEIGTQISAEGVETRGELQMLQSLGVDRAQGFYLSHPVSLEEALRLEAAAPFHEAFQSEPSLQKRLF